MKKILLVGDSIRLSYMPGVQKLLEGKADVWGSDDNARFAKYTLWYIVSWMAHFNPPDIIHWNNGIWDAYNLYPEKGVFTPLDVYMEEMKQIYAVMKKSGAQVIFATTTAVNDAFVPVKNKDIDLYNEKMTEFARSVGMPVNDLNGLIRQDKATLVSEDLFHLSAKGIELAAQQTAKTLEAYLD